MGLPALPEIVRTDDLLHLEDTEAWMVAEDIPDMDLFFSQGWQKSFANVLSNSCGKNYKRVLSFWRGYHMQFYYGQEDCHEFAKHLLNKLKSDPSWGDVINQNIVSVSDELVRHAQTVGAADLKRQTNAQLWQHYEKHVEIHLRLYEWGWLPNAVDMFYPEFTNYLKAILRGKAESEEQVNTWFVALTTSEKETIATQEHKDVIRLALQIQNDEHFLSLFEKGAGHVAAHTPESWKKQIAAVHEKYKHLKFMYHGEAAKLDDVYFVLEPLLYEKKNLAAELRRIEELPANTRKSKAALMEQLALTEKQRHLFEVFAEFMYTKWHRRNAQILSFYHLEPLLKEIAGRLGLNLQQVRTLLWSEVKDGLLENKKIDPQAIEERFAYFAYYVENGKEQLFTGAEAQQLEKRAKTVTIDHNVKELIGQTACLGKATGTARLVLGAKDLHKMQKGDILVAIATDPDVVPGMKIASAIVTEQGGVTSHAAIVSRELGVPCVIGTKIATKWLKDGDRIEVDATKGTVRKLS